MMGAGNACSSMYSTNPNLNTFGGNKKQGIASRVGLDAWANYPIQTNANGIGRTKLFIMNQLGGVGVGRSMFNTSFVQPRGLMKNDVHGKSDINDLADWDGEKHVLRQSSIVHPGQTLTHAKLHVPKDKTLTVHGNMDSTDMLTVEGHVHIHGMHVTRKGFHVLKNGSYHVHGNSRHTASGTTTKDTQTVYGAVYGKYEVLYGGSSYTASGLTCDIYGTFQIDSGGRYDNYGVINNYYYLSITGSMYNSGIIYNNFNAASNSGQPSVFAQVYIHSGGTLVNFNKANANKQNNNRGYLFSSSSEGNTYITAKQDGRIYNNSPNFSINGTLTTYPDNGIEALAGSTINVLKYLDISAGDIKIYSNVLSSESLKNTHNSNSKITYVDDKQYYDLTYMYQTDDTIFFQINIGGGSALYEHGFATSRSQTLEILSYDVYDGNPLISHDYDNIKAIISSPATTHDHRKTLSVDKSLFNSLTGIQAYRIFVRATNTSPEEPSNVLSKLFSASPFIFDRSMKTKGEVVGLNGVDLP
jgi:hypothetical protein